MISETSAGGRKRPRKHEGPEGTGGRKTKRLKPSSAGTSRDGGRRDLLTSMPTEMDSVFMPFGGLDLELDLGGHDQALKQSATMQSQPFPSPMDFQQVCHAYVSYC